MPVSIFLKKYTDNIFRLLFISGMSSTFQFSNNSITVKELPHNIEAEQGLLGAILLNNEIYYDIIEIINIEHFMSPYTAQFLML